MKHRLPASLLASLPHVEYQRLLAAGLEPVSLKFGEVLHESGMPIRYVYFPVNCVVSLLTTAKGRRPLEVMLVGHEGVVGISLALGIGVSFARTLVQSTGTAMRMESAPFRKEFLRSKPLQQVLDRYTHGLICHLAQSAACNHFHSVRERLARYLLTTGDRARSREFRLTQEFLADMLGVRRVGVTVIARALQERKLIKYRRGDISLLDPRGLNAVACGCYKVVKDVYDSAYADR